MDSLSYLVTITLLIVFMLCSLIFLKFKSSKFLLLFPCVLLPVSLGMFGAYVYGLYGLEHTDGIPVTFFMRLFMLDDNVTKGNIQTGFITSLLPVAICIIYAIVFVYKFKAKNKY